MGFGHTSRERLFWKLVRENSELVNLRRLSKQITGLGFFHQSRRHFAVEVCIAPGLVVKRIEDGERGRLANQEIVPGSAFTKGTAERRKSATSFSFPGLACNGT